MPINSAGESRCFRDLGIRCRAGERHVKLPFRFFSSLNFVDLDVEKASGELFWGTFIVPRSAMWRICSYSDRRDLASSGRIGQPDCGLFR